MHKQNFIKIHSLFLKILRKFETLTSITGHEKFGKISYASHNTPIFLKILNGNKMTSIKGHNSVEKKKTKNIL